MTEIKKGNPTSKKSSLDSFRSSKRHAAVVEKLLTIVKLLDQDGELEHSSLGVFPAVLGGAASRFLEDCRRRRVRRHEAISSTRPVHFMDSRDRGPSTRAEREAASQATVKARAAERDRAYIDRGG